MQYRIPFNRAFIPSQSLSCVQEAIRRGHISGEGPYSRKCSEYLKELLGANAVMLTSSCTDALEMSALLLDINLGDEVIVPSFTFVSTANAFALYGAKIVFADINAETLSMDEMRLEALFTHRTKVVIPVHYAGVGCRMEKILEIAGRHNVQVVEDNAHGLFGKYQGRWLGSFGGLATLSFHETKNITSGEGGGLIINKPELVKRAEIIHEKGTDRRQFFRGIVDKYTWRDIGSSYVCSDILAAILWPQLEGWKLIQTKRETIWKHYEKSLSSWASARGVRLPIIPADCEQAYHMFYMLLPTEEIRNALIEHFRRAGILGVFHYHPLHLSPMGIKYGGKKGDCPVTEQVSKQLIRLPFYTDMTKDEQDQVINVLLDFSC